MFSLFDVRIYIIITILFYFDRWAFFLYIRQLLYLYNMIIYIFSLNELCCHKNYEKLLHLITINVAIIFITKHAV